MRTERRRNRHTGEPIRGSWSVESPRWSTT